MGWKVSGNGGCTPIQREKADSSHKYAVLLVSYLAQAAGFFRNSLKLRCGFGIIGREFNWSASGKVLKRAEMPFMKSNGKSELKEGTAVS